LSSGHTLAELALSRREDTLATMQREDHLLRQIDRSGLFLRRMTSALTGQVEERTARPAHEVEQELAECPPFHNAIVERSPERLLKIMQQHYAFNTCNSDLLADLLLALAER